MLQRLAGSGLAPRAYGYRNGWLLVEWLPGEPVADFAGCCGDGSLAAYLARLHHRPRYGFPLPLKALLARHWRNMSPARRSPALLRRHRHFQRCPLPAALIDAPLHLDVHAGNLLRHDGGLRLIDWEYAADGDVALELAALARGGGLDAAQQALVLRHYARHWPALSPDALRQRVAQWLPWVDFLMLLWYEVRWRQCGQDEYLQAAASSRRRLGLPG